VVTVTAAPLPSFIPRAVDPSAQSGSGATASVAPGAVTADVRVSRPFKQGTDPTSSDASELLPATTPTESGTSARTAPTAAVTVGQDADEATPVPAAPTPVSATKRVPLQAETAALPTVQSTSPSATAAVPTQSEVLDAAAKAATQGVPGVSGRAESRASLAYQKAEATATDQSAAFDSAVRSVAGVAAKQSGQTATGGGHGESGARRDTSSSASDLASLYAGAARLTQTESLASTFSATTATTVVARESAAQPTSGNEPLNQAIVKSLRMQWQQGGGEATLKLNPEYLGDLSVSLRVQGSTVSAVLQADSPTVRSWIEEHQQDLRRALEDAGLSLDSLVINADGQSNSRQQGTPQQRQQAPARQQAATAGFEALL